MGASQKAYSTAAPFQCCWLVEDGNQRAVIAAPRVPASGVMFINVGRIINDGQAYSHGYWRQATKAMVVSGVLMGR